MQDYELYTIWLSLLISFLDSTSDVRVLISGPSELVIFLLHHFEYLAFKSAVLTYQMGISLFL